jgi:hypothetical protein
LDGSVCAVIIAGSGWAAEEGSAAWTAIAIAPSAIGNVSSGINLRQFKSIAHVLSADPPVWVLIIPVREEEGSSKFLANQRIVGDYIPHWRRKTTHLLTAPKLKRRQAASISYPFIFTPLGELS